MVSNYKVPRSVKLPSDLNAAVNSVLKTNGESFSAFVTEAVSEKIEDMLDIETLTEAIKNRDDDKLYTLEEAKKELDL